MLKELADAYLWKAMELAGFKVKNVIKQSYCPYGYSVCLENDVLDIDIFENGDIVWNDFTHRTSLGNLNDSSCSKKLAELEPLRGEELAEFIRLNPYESE